MGQPLIVIAAAGLTGALTLGYADFSSDVVDVARARTAADAAALAGVAGGRDAAERLASRNGGTVVSWARSADEVTVTVRVGSARAVARATDVFDADGSRVDP